jgi:hypothetical protein
MALVFKLCQNEFRTVLNYTFALNLGALQHYRNRLELLPTKQAHAAFLPKIIE